MGFWDLPPPGAWLHGDPTRDSVRLALALYALCVVLMPWLDEAGWRAGTALGRLVRLVDRASATMLHVQTDRITPMAVPLMVIVGREAAPPGGEADEALLTQAEALAEAAMRL